MTNKLLLAALVAMCAGLLSNAALAECTQTQRQAQANPAGNGHVDVAQANPAGSGHVDVAQANPAGNSHVDVAQANPAGNGHVDVASGDCK